MCTIRFSRECTNITALEIPRCGYVDYAPQKTKTAARGKVKGTVDSPVPGRYMDTGVRGAQYPGELGYTGTRES